MFLICGKTFTQPPLTNSNSGIYESPQNYKKGKLSLGFSCDSSAGKIKLHHFISGKYVDVIRNGKKYRLSKDSIFGYRDCKGNNYRFFKNYSHEYQIVEEKGLVIYAALLPDPNYTGKGMKLAPAYFFSKTLTSEVLPLKVSYLKRVFREDTRFCNILDIAINSKEDVSAYDDIHKMFKINYLLTQSINPIQ